MGWFQPAGAGSAIYCYDDADVTAGPGAACTTVAPSIASTTNGTTLITSAALFGPVSVNDTISGADIPANTFVSIKTDNSNITMSNAATGSSVAARTFGSVNLTSAALFGPFSAGNTITGPNILAGTTISVKTDNSNIIMSQGATGAATVTRYFTAAAALHVSGPHTWAECNTAFPVDFPRMQDAAGNFYTGTPRQYLPKVLVTIGNPAVAGNATSFVDTSDSSVFVSGARLAFTTANPASTSFTLGTKIGAGTRMTGKNGGTIYMSSALVFRGTVSLYGTKVNTTGSLQFLNGTGIAMEIAGCSLQAGVGSVIVLGNSAGIALRLYNNNISSTSSGNIITATFVTEGANNIVGCTSPTSFLSTAGSNILIGSMVLSGAPTISDFRSTGGTGWNLNNVSYSDTPAIPRFSFAGGTVSLANAHQEFWDFDTKVVDPNGNSMSGIPVVVTSDIDGLILDDVTGPDGAVVFTWPPTGVSNVLPVRDHYCDAGLNYLTQDRTYLLEVNGFSGSTAPTQGYATQFITFEWPGRDRFGAGYSEDGGSFTHVHDIVQLQYGHPTTGQHTPWIERVAP